MLLDFANRAFEHDVSLMVVTPADGPLVRILQTIGVPTAIVPAPEALLRASHQLGQLRAVPSAFSGTRAWAKQLTAHEFVKNADVMYSVSFKPHLTLSLARVHPVVWHLHEFPPTRFGRLWPWLAHRADGLLASSESVAHAWAKATARPTVVLNGVNLDRFRPAERTHWIHNKLGIPHNHRLIGIPAAYAPWKGHLEVIDAFAKLHTQFPHVHLIVVGGSIYDTAAEKRYSKAVRDEILKTGTGEFRTVMDMPERRKAKPSDSRSDDTTESADVQPDVQPEVLPFQSDRLRVHRLNYQRKIERVYPEFDIVVHYSTRPEAFGRVIVEAMASGIPVIAANEGGPVEILGRGTGSSREPGWLVQPRNTEALVRTLSDALTLPRADLQSIGEAGRRRAEDHFSARRFAADVAKFLKSLEGKQQ